MPTICPDQLHFLRAGDAPTLPSNTNGILFYEITSTHFMKKYIYIGLSIVSLCLLGYTGYYAYSHATTPAPVAITTLPVATTTPPVVDKNKLTTKSGKAITIKETNPTSQGLSTITLSLEGFATNTSIVLETNKLKDFFLADLNNDTFEELILTTTAEGSGSYGGVTLYTTAKNESLTPVNIPLMRETDMKKGGLFEGYMGHDTFSLVDGTLIREFPLYTATDTNSTPTGGLKKVAYLLSEKDGVFSVTFSKLPQVSTTTTPLTATTSPLIASSTKASTAGSLPAASGTPVVEKGTTTLKK